MSEQVPEIFTKKVERLLAQGELEARILNFLASRRLCVLSTSRDNEPRSTPILFRSKGFTLYMAGEPGLKLGNIMQNPDVSVGIFDPKAEFSDEIEDITGLQISGHARLISREDAGFSEAFKLFGRPQAWAEHWFGKMIEVIPDRIEMLSMGLKLEGYAARQIWSAAGEKK
ncbi:pyridoxamine 5'-phosphate oxidase family protein [Chlorobium ferrooxidans]|uniref:Pyridoxamine 5'-phosphate oxidase-related, FMN-binding n=1 Tax=Chlorobium ferrooxidans DSM 13031 TaxID=377431 RepID=Q0YQI8_9CHLB|nr:pyridoxamine 5'-phosphate oxidase family protein [Chlorobium ferrooxidans]EAT58523.1 Pyridoxamine 5'-phosphate oxidase-related, FMN-binding [Chlorobium ferrooxidans DSM 13031]